MMSNEDLPDLLQEGMWSCTVLLACVNAAPAPKAAVPGGSTKRCSECTQDTGCNIAQNIPIISFPEGTSASQLRRQSVMPPALLAVSTAATCTPGMRLCPVCARRLKCSGSCSTGGFSCCWRHLPISVWRCPRTNSSAINALVMNLQNSLPNSTMGCHLPFFNSM